jgi:hypothetical protein
VDLSGEGAHVGRIGFWDGFWVRAFPKSYSWSWCGLLLVEVAAQSDTVRLVCFDLAGIDDGTFELRVWALAFDLVVGVGPKSMVVRQEWGDR